MEITWYGLGCLRIIERGYPAIVTDPFDEEETSYPLPHLRADVVTSSVPRKIPERCTGRYPRDPRSCQPG
jgi:hypothetical protein